MIRYRQELVGKRFLSINNSSKLNLSKICEWPWRNGIIRASSHNNDANDEELTVLVEFDDLNWKSREWVRVYDKTNFQVFFVEHTVVWAPRKDPRNQSRNNCVLWPALSFKALVDGHRIGNTKTQPVEFLLDKERAFVDYTGLANYQDGDETTQPITLDRTEVRDALRQWVDHHDGQAILLTTPSVTIGNRVQVYRAEGTTQWYTAVIGSYNETTRELNLTDDTVLESHNEDPSLVHMRLLGDGVVESIRKGEIVGITPRRRTCTLNNTTHVGHYTRSSRNSTVCSSSHGTHVKNSSVNSKKINRRREDLAVECKDKPLRTSPKPDTTTKPTKTEGKPITSSTNPKSPQPQQQQQQKPTEEKIPKKRFKLKRPFPSTTNLLKTTPTPIDQNDAVTMETDNIVIKPSNRLHVFTTEDHCSDSGISDKSGIRSSDERSASRSSDSSRLSDDRSGSRPSVEETVQSPLVFDRSESINVWRDPKLLTSDESNVRHVQSIQHSLVSVNNNHHRNNNNNNKYQAPYSNLVMHRNQSSWRGVSCEGEGLMDASRYKRDQQEQMRRSQQQQQVEHCEQQERAQREAVQQHFEESLRLASQDSGNINWNTAPKTNVVEMQQQIDLSSRPKQQQQHHHLSKQTDLPLRYLNQDKRPMMYSNTFTEQHEQWLLQQRDLQRTQLYHNLESCIPNPQRKTGYNYPNTNKGSLVPGVPPVSSVQLPKSEPSFNLYGYQPSQHSFIKAEKLDHHPQMPIKNQEVTRNPPPPPIPSKSVHDKFAFDPNRCPRTVCEQRVDASYSPANITTSTYSRHVYTNASNLGVIKPTSSATSLQPSSKTAEPPVTLIQQGLVPNPMYNYSSLSSVSENRTPPVVSSYGTTVRPGITTGTPIHRNQNYRGQEVEVNRYPNIYQRYPQESLPSTSTSCTNQPAVYQTQPLNLEASDNIVNNNRQWDANSPPNTAKRKILNDATSPRKRCKTATDPVLSRVSAPSPLIVDAATTISTIVNTVTLTTASSVISSSKPSSGFFNSYLTFVNASRQESGPDNEKSVSPVTTTTTTTTTTTATNINNNSNTGSVTKLKKAWLQRHSDEDNFINNNKSINTSPNVAVSSDSAVNCNVTSGRSVNGGNYVDQVPMSLADDDESTCSAAETEMELAMESNKLIQEAKKSIKVEDCQSIKVEEIDVVNQPKKRGRKPKPKNIKQEPVKKSKNYFEKSPLSKLKRTGVSFLQDGSCCDVAPKLNKCRECRMTNQRSKKMLNIFCRFYAFRKLRYSKNGYMAYSGFSEPKAASEEDMKLWLPQAENPPSDLNLETSKFILSHVGNQFCDLVHQEQEAQGVHIGEDKMVAWKRVVQGVREMCDVCETTLFNYHWACGKCGFVVCIDCYKARKNSNLKFPVDEKQNYVKDSDRYSWMLCNNRQPHEQDKLMLTQIIADNALWEVGKLVHTVGKRWNIAMHCVCVLSTRDCKQPPMSNGICKQLMSAVSQCFEERKTPTSNGISDPPPPPVNYTPDVASSPLSWLADVALNDSNNKLTSTKSTKSIKEEEHFSTLRELLIRPSGNKKNGSNSNSNTKSVMASLSAIPRKPLNTLDDVINCMIEQSVNKQDDVTTREEKLLLHYTRRFPQPRSGWDPLPIRIFTLSESQLLFPDVPHSWLCAGRLLRLHDPVHKNNIKLFQEQWKRGQPVLVSEVSRALDITLWHPEAFARDFGDIKNDLVNCHTGNIVPDQPMRKFWEGFENLTKRMQDDTGEYMLLKLKDWPPGDDFSEMLPSRFQDLMKVLPLPEYTHRNGRLNLAGRLPDCFVRPDLGPKMYNAYGSALFPSKGTTNLHLDISDAVNVMVYVGIPKDGNSEQHIKEALKAIDDAGCDVLTRRRVREAHERPGALWHIYNARDADKIRDLLNKVAIERGEKLEPHHDPIHDQSWYLDTALRERLYLEYGVEGYAIAQCLGDAVFIPAGAPHQVRNLHSCIKVAEDFVSPENVSHCFTLTQEFRHLSDTHSNHEDKLQVKNIIYHAVRDALSVLLANEKHRDPS